MPAAAAGGRPSARHGARAASPRWTCGAGRALRVRHGRDAGRGPAREPDPREPAAHRPGAAGGRPGVRSRLQARSGHPGVPRVGRRLPGGPGGAGSRGGGAAHLLRELCGPHGRAHRADPGDGRAGLLAGVRGGDARGAPAQRGRPGPRGGGRRLPDGRGAGGRRRHRRGARGAACRPGAARRPAWSARARCG
eukprot:10011767-Lingulodinium_polyedra.AAC.1